MNCIEKLLGPRYDQEAIDITKTAQGLSNFSYHLEYANPDEWVPSLVVRQDPGTKKLYLEVKEWEGLFDHVTCWFKGSLRERNIQTVFRRTIAELQQNWAKYEQQPDLEKSLLTCSMVLHEDRVCDTFDFIRFIVQQKGIDSHQLGKKGLSLLDHAIIHHDSASRNKMKLIRFMVEELHADIDKPNGTKISPLGMAVLCSNGKSSDLVQFLVKDLHAQLNSSYNLSRIPFDIALSRRWPKILEVLKGEVSESVDCDELLKMCELAAIWGLDYSLSWVDHPNATIFALLGKLRSEDTMALFKKFALSFLEQPICKSSLSEPERNLVKQAVQNGLTTTNDPWQRICSIIHSKRPFVMSHVLSFIRIAKHEGFAGGLGHDFGLAAYNDQIALCNRGPGTSSHAVEIYNINASQINYKDVRSIFSHWNQPSVFYRELQHVISPTILKLEHKPQKKGNCVWTSIEATIHPLLYMILKERSHIEEESLRNIAKDLYKAFTTHARTEILNEYLRKAKQPRPQLLQKILVKVINHPERFGAEEQKFIELLVSHGADINKAKEERLDKEQVSPLFCAIAQNDFEAAKGLVRNGVDANLTDSAGNSVLLLAVAIGNFKIVRLLLEYGARDVPNKEGLTALMLAKEMNCSLPLLETMREISQTP